MFSRELNNANTVKRMADFLGHHLRIMKKIILILAAMLTFAACTKEGDVIYQTDPAERDFIRRNCRGAAPAESVLWQYSDGGQTRYDSKH